MNAKFNADFNNWLAEKKYYIIPTAETYKKILSTFEKLANKELEPSKITIAERNWLTRYIKIIMNLFN